MPAQTISYQRVSSVGQKTTRQLDGLNADREFVDKVTGANSERPALVAMLEHIREGDIVHVHSIDRLARNLKDLLSIIEKINSVGASVTFQKESLTFDGSDDAMQRMQLQLFGMVAEFERSLINERAAEGRAIAKAKGVRFGRKAKLTSNQVSEIRALHNKGKSVRALALDFDVARTTISRVLKKDTSAA